MSQRAKGVFWLALAASIAFAFAGGLPRLAALTPWSWERRARWLLPGPDAQICSGSAGSDAALAKLVGRLYPVLPGDRDFPLRVRVVRGKRVNAFASLGGRVYLYDGLLAEAESPEELAGVLAHEIEHVKRRHIIEGALVRLLPWAALQFALGRHADPRAVVGLLGLSFSRRQERQADQGGLERLRAARVNAAGFESFFERAAREPRLASLLSDHPSDASRAELARRYLGGPAEPVLTPQEWASLKAICR